MQTSTLILLFGFVACIFAERGGHGGWHGGRGGFGKGGFGRGGHMGGADKFPQSCKTDAENAKQCFADNVKAKGVNVNIDDVKACFEKCQRPEGGANGGNRPERPEGGSRPERPEGGSRPERPEGGNRPERPEGGNRTEGSAKGGNGNGNGNGRRGDWGGRRGGGAHGNWSQVHEQMKTYGECIKNKLGDKQEQCVKGKISYSVASKDETQDGKGGHRRGGRGGFGNPLQSLPMKVERCGAETEACVKAAMGEWYEKTDELSAILCNASTACPHTTSDACKADRAAGRKAACECREQLQPDVDQAKKDCTTPEIQEFVDRMGSRGKGEHRQRSCDEQDDREDRPQRQRPSPFCPRPERQGGWRHSKRG